jgi:hypothetical protein
MTGSISEDTATAVQEVFPGIEFADLVTGRTSLGFELSSWNAGVLDSGEVPYLGRLSSYLATEELAVHHLEKLRRVVSVLGAGRRHLYLLIASIGRWGDVRSTSPGWFLEGDFIALTGLTDLSVNFFDVVDKRMEIEWKLSARFAPITAHMSARPVAQAAHHMLHIGCHHTVHGKPEPTRSIIVAVPLNCGAERSGEPRP